MSLMPFSGRLLLRYRQAAVQRSWDAMGSHWKGVPALGTKGAALTMMRVLLCVFQSVFNRQGQFDDFLDIIIGLGGQADDEIELELGEVLPGNHVHRFRISSSEMPLLITSRRRWEPASGAMVMVCTLPLASSLRYLRRGYLSAAS